MSQALPALRRCPSRTEPRHELHRKYHHPCCPTFWPAALKRSARTWRHAAPARQALPAQQSRACIQWSGGAAATAAAATESVWAAAVLRRLTLGVPGSDCDVELVRLGTCSPLSRSTRLLRARSAILLQPSHRISLRGEAGGARGIVRLRRPRGFSSSSSSTPERPFSAASG